MQLALSTKKGAAGMVGEMQMVIGPAPWLTAERTKRFGCLSGRGARMERSKSVELDCAANATREDGTQNARLYLRIQNGFSREYIGDL